MKPKGKDVNYSKRVRNKHKLLEKLNIKVQQEKPRLYTEKEVGLLMYITAVTYTDREGPHSEEEAKSADKQIHKWIDETIKKHNLR